VERKKFIFPIVSGVVLLGGVGVILLLYQNTALTQSVVLLTTYIAITFASIYDWRLMKIPNIVPLALFGARIVLFGIEYLTEGGLPAELFSSVLGCLIAGALLFVSSKMSHGGIGAGDIKLFAAIGFACGIEMTFSVLLTALIVCAVSGGVLVLLKRRTAKDALPFAPFIWCGFVLTMLISAS
jgi:prepilin signal peptidase PulO-like enzyme (type II secretory pathway)